MAQTPPKPASSNKSSDGINFPKFPRWVWWTSGILLALVLIVGGVWIYLLRTGGLEFGGRLVVVRDFGPEGAKPGAAKPAQPGPAKPEPGGERTHTVKSGENLWKIAKSGALVDSAWEWRTILVQNRDKIQYAFLSEDDGGWKVILDEGQELKVKGDASAALPDGQVTPDRQFAVQMATVPEDRMERGMRIVRQLMTDGQFAYLYRHEADGKRFLRIRVGFYHTEDEAKQAGQALIAHYPKWFKEYWAMRPSDVELKGGHLDFGVQQARPWVVQLPQRVTHHDALEDLRAVASIGEFVYIAQKRDGDFSPASYLYRTRIGFFANEDEAKRFVDAHKGAAPLLSESQPVRVDSFTEALPGQNIRMGKPG